MDFLIYSAYSVAIADFEFREVLVFCVETVIEMRNGFAFFTLFKLEDQAFHFDNYIAFHLAQYFKKFGMALLVFSVVPHKVFVQ